MYRIRLVGKREGFWVGGFWVGPGSTLTNEPECAALVANLEWARVSAAIRGGVVEVVK